jgi:anti-anti-sigma factor
VDCQELAFIDASGLGVFADAIRRNGEIVLHGVAPELRRVFQVAGVAELASSEE